MKRSATLWVLVTFFVWAALKSAGSIYGAQSVSEYALLSWIGWAALFYILTVPIMFGEAATAFLLFKKKAKAYWVGSVVVLAECASGIFMSVLTALHADTASAMYVASREVRGLSTRQHSEIEFMFSPTGIGLMALAYLAFWALIFYYLRRVRVELQH